MKNIYYSKDIINGLIQEIPLGTKVIMKVEPIFKRKFIKGNLIKNDDNCIGVDYPKELGGTFLSKEAIEYIKILNKGNVKMNENKESIYLNKNIGIRKDYLYKIMIENVGVITGEILNFNGCTYVIKSYKDGEFNHYIVKYKNILDLHPVMTMEQYNK